MTVYLSPTLSVPESVKRRLSPGCSVERFSRNVSEMVGFELSDTAVLVANTLFSESLATLGRSTLPARRNPASSRTTARRRSGKHRAA
jgi:hypothetical protein